MRINNNLMAMNTHRQLGIANGAGAKSMEKLSSGFRINRAGDDAAGLAISEKMRGQIRGLNQASTNAQDGISLIQTAEGALNETHAILQRMRELAVQSATDTNTQADRSNLQDEINELTAEIDRIADTTQFNTMTLLDGTFNDKAFHIGANEGQVVDLEVSSMKAGALKLDVNEEVDLADKVGKAEIEAGDESQENVEFKSTNPDISEVTVAVSTKENSEDAGVVKDENGKITLTLKKEATLADFRTELGKLGVTFDLGKDTKLVDSEAVKGLTIELALPKDAPKQQVTGVNVMSREESNKSITKVNDALETVSKQRSKLGAVQNRLEHTIKNLDTSAENLQASESRIRDVDMAKEMMEQTKQNILQQASTAMLAQANMAPQTVLQLLG